MRNRSAIKHRNVVIAVLKVAWLALPGGPYFVGRDALQKIREEKGGSPSAD